MSDYDEARKKIIARFLHDIEEYCDGCQVLLSGRDPNDQTWSMDCGIGNWHARLWVAANFVDSHQEGFDASFILEAGDEGEEEGGEDGKE